MGRPYDLAGANGTDLNWGAPSGGTTACGTKPGGGGGAKASGPGGAMATPGGGAAGFCGITTGEGGITGGGPGGGNAGDCIMTGSGA